jgi:Cu-processing system permease protein
MIVLEDYPLDNFGLVVSFLNPIDLSRILIILKLDISALLGYTGAVFQKFFGTNSGMVFSLLILSAWVIFPVFIMIRTANKKDF